MVDYSSDPWAAYNNNYANVTARGKDQQATIDNMLNARAAKEAGVALGNNDYKGAANALYSRGNVDAGLKVQDYGQAQDKAKREQQITVLGRAAKALRDIPDPQARIGVLQNQIAPALQSVGIGPDVISQIAHSDLSDQSLDAFMTTLGQEAEKLQIVPSGGGGYNAVDPRKGRVVYSQAPSVIDPTKTYLDYGNGQPTPAAAAPAAPASAPSGDPVQAGGDNYLARLGQVESNNNPNAKNGSSTGLYQFHPDTFARLGGTDINNADQQKAAALKLAQESAQQLQGAGVPVDDANLYIMHQQGSGGGLALLKAPPETNAIAALTPVYGNPTRARQAIVNNGGTPDMTAGQFVQMWRQKWGQGAQQSQSAQPYQVASNGDTPPPPSGMNLPAGARVIHAAQPKPTTRPATAAEKAQYGIPADTPAQIKPDGTIEPIKVGDTGVEPLGPGNSESSSLLAQTGLSMPAFLAITGQASKLPRDAATRNRAFKEAEQFANQRGVDISTMGSQYDAYNKTLQSNIMRNNQTKILEGEIDGTIGVLQPLADQAGMGNLRIGNVAKLFAGKEVNDPTVQQYRQQLLILQSELAGMNAAARGNIDQSGNVKTDQSDMQDAARVILSGLNSRGAGGLAQTIRSTTDKNRTVLENNIDGSRKAIWDLFGVGQNYKPTSASQVHSAVGASKGLTPAQLKAVAPFKGSTAPEGSAGNPVVTRTKADYDRLKSGQHYVFTDGRVMVKP